jgi:hypothetical protein
MPTSPEAEGITAEAQQRTTGSPCGADRDDGSEVAQPRILIARTARALGLDARQASRLRKALCEERKRRRAVRQRLSECRAQLRAALSVGEPDPREVWELAREERVLLERERSPHPDLEPVLASILTAEQILRLRRRSSI